MSKTRLSSPQRKARRSAALDETQPQHQHQSRAGEVLRFVGLSLGGGKADKACLAIIEFFPAHGKIFLSKLVEKIKSDEVLSADYKIVEIIKSLRDVQSVAFDVPFSYPQCAISCVNTCDGIEKCPSEHVRWMWDYTRKLNKKKKPKRLFTPYTQRCVEMYLATELEEPFNLQDALGANTAPLLARAHYLRRHLHENCIEVFPKLSLWRIGRSLNIMKSHLRFHKHAIGGSESRREILMALGKHNIAFVYDQDVRIMIDNNHAFEAFLCALTGFLKHKQLTQERPAKFPVREDWVEFPVPAIKWNRLFS